VSIFLFSVTQRLDEVSELARLRKAIFQGDRMSTADTHKKSETGEEEEFPVSDIGE